MMRLHNGVVDFYKGLYVKHMAAGGSSVENNLRDCYSTPGFPHFINSSLGG
jgi:hypothetical protein